MHFRVYVKNTEQQWWCGDQLVFEKNRQNGKNVCVDIGNSDLGKTANHFGKALL